MTKVSRTTLVDTVQEELITYLRNGTINERSVARTLDVTDLNIENLDRLKRIHFCLSDDVVSFIDGIQEQLRRIKTANQREREFTRGEVRGGIDWQATTRRRFTEAAGDRTRFACKTPYTEYDIAENLVLKKLLWVVHSTVQADISDIDYEWATTVWSKDRIAMFDRTYGRNVHLNRIRDGEDITVTPRMLNTARSARQSLYTEAYTLYNRYRRLLQGKYRDPDVSQLLSDTLIVPERLPRLFELFCVFQMLKALDSQSLTLQPIEPGSERIAVLEDDRYIVDVYHDQAGGLSFHVPLSVLDGVEADYVERIRHSQQRHSEAVENFLGNETEDSLFSGRPDIVIEIYEGSREALAEVVLGEIKYSDRTQTFTRGLEELIKYMEFAQEDGYLSGQEVDIRGLIITDGPTTDTPTFADGLITHLTADRLQSESEPHNWIPERLH